MPVNNNLSQINTIPLSTQTQTKPSSSIQNSVLESHISGRRVSINDPKSSLSSRFASFFKKSSSESTNTSQISTIQSSHKTSFISEPTIGKWQRFKNIFKKSISTEAQQLKNETAHFKENINLQTLNVKELRSTKLGKQEIDACAKKMYCQESTSFLDSVSEYDQLVEQFEQSGSIEKLEEIKNKYTFIVKTYISTTFTNDIPEDSHLNLNPTQMAALEAPELEINIPDIEKEKFGMPFDQKIMKDAFKESNIIIEATLGLALNNSPHFKKVKEYYN
ncbi:MAG: hypothetical protein H0X29_02825 [Parachlamydiaceae bacterium]|nr:hypothetical protein [Parachlamydiaceae bacterium]